MKKRSFTLIEIIVVIGIIAFVLPALFAIIFSILQQQSRIYNLMEVKRQGDNALVTMQNIIKNNALKIYKQSLFTDEVCGAGAQSYVSTDGSEFYFKDKSGNYFRFYLDSNNKIASQSPTSIDGIVRDSTIALTNTKVTVSDFEIRCDRLADYSTPLVSIKFTVNFNPAGQYPMNYYSKIKLKNY